MVTILTQVDDLQRLIGRKLPRDHEQLNEILYSVKCELSGLSRTGDISEDSELQLENKDTNRPDTWSTEGIARALRGLLGVEMGLETYMLAKKPAVEIKVEKELKEIRPYIACVVAHGAKLNDVIIRGLIHLQEKLDQSYGRKRRRSSIGFYDFDLITPPLTYGATGPDDVRFVPLEGVKEMSLREILDSHPKGIEYGHIVREHEKMPILLDSKSKVLSFPPIINSNDLGRVTPETKNILVEVTGTSEETVMNAVTILTTTLADRGARISPAIIHYRYNKPRTVKTPNLSERRIKLPIESLRGLIGVEIKHAQLVSLLRRARYDVSTSNRRELTVRVPCYRLDILHLVDVLEDVAIAYGLNKMKPKWPPDLTFGGLSPMEEFSDRVRELTLGLGFQEILSFMMTNPEKLFTKMNRVPGDVVEVTNPKLITMTCLRPWLLPSLIEFLANNTHVEYPQRVFEVGECTIWDSTVPNRARDIRKLACVSTHSKANFTEMKASLQPLMLNLGFEFTVSPIVDPSYLEGRVGSIHIGGREVGIIGEVHPQVLENWRLENPAVAIELDLEQLFQLQRR
jgi:phenylalanyl-tRNA synthetase beta chain